MPFQIDPLVGQSLNLLSEAARAPLEAETKAQTSRLANVANEAALRRVALAEKADKRAEDEIAIRNKSDELYGQFASISPKQTTEGGSTRDAQGNIVLTDTGKKAVLEGYKPIESAAMAKYGVEQQQLLKQRQAAIDPLLSELNTVEQQIRGDYKVKEATTKTQRVNEGGKWVTKEVTTPPVYRKKATGHDKRSLEEKRRSLQARLNEVQQTHANAIQAHTTKYSQDLANVAKALETRASNIKPTSERLSLDAYRTKLNEAHKEWLDAKPRSQVEIVAANRAKKQALQQYEATDAASAKVAQDIALTSVKEKLKGQTQIQVAKAKADIDTAVAKASSRDKERLLQLKAAISDETDPEDIASLTRKLDQYLKRNQS